MHGTFMATFRRERQARAKRVFSHIRRLSCARWTRYAGRFASAITKKGAVEESNPSRQLKGLSDLLGMTETAIALHV